MRGGGGALTRWRAGVGMWRSCCARGWGSPGETTHGGGAVEARRGAGVGEAAEALTQGNCVDCGPCLGHNKQMGLLESVYFVLAS
jgi:hypothetical protein